MDIQGIIKDDRKKKILIIGLAILFFIILGLIFFLTRGSSSGTQEDSQAQLLADFAKLSPRSGVATSTLSLMPKIALLADRTTVDPGQPVKISWDARNVTSCVDINGDTLELIGSKSVLPKETYTFDILCTGPEGTDLQSITIAVTGVPSIALYAYPDEVKLGEQSVISWSATNADRCVDSVGKVLRLSGSLSVSPKSLYTFIMSCTGPKGTTRKSVTISIAKPLATGTSGGTTSGGTTGGTTSGGTTGGTTGGTAGNTPSVELSASPTQVDYNRATTLTWKLQNVTYCVFTSDGPLGGLPPFTYANGNRTTSKLITAQKFTLSCTKGSTKIEKSVTVTVGPKPLIPTPDFANDFNITPRYVATFGQVKARWKALDSTGCVLNKNSAVFKTSLPISNSNYIIYEQAPGNSIYTLTCTGPSGTVTSEPITVSVVNCEFTRGFGTTDAEAKKIVSTEDDANLRVEEDGSFYGLGSGPVCTYTYAGSDGKWDSFSKIFNSMSGGQPRATQSPIAKTAIAPLGATDLCKYTYYGQEIVNGNTNSIGYFNSKYHNNWATIAPTTEETHAVTTYEKVGTEKCAAGTKRCNIMGYVTRNLTGVNYLKCQVK